MDQQRQEGGEQDEARKRTKPNDEERRCRRCGETKDILAFGINNTFPSGIKRRHTCNVCRKHQCAVRVKLRREHGSPPNVPCPICERPLRLFMDHDHDTDQFRGWLCNDCNNGMGKFGDSPVMLQRAIDYLAGRLIVSSGSGEPCPGGPVEQADPVEPGQSPALLVA